MYLREYECSPPFIKIANLGAMQSLVDDGTLSHLGKFIYNSAKQESFQKPYFRCEDDWHTLYNLYEVKNDDDEDVDDAKVYAVFDSATKATINERLDRSYKKYHFNVFHAEKYAKPAELLIPLQWSDDLNEQKEEKDSEHEIKRAMWWLVRVKLTYNQKGKIDKKEVIIYGRQSNEEHLEKIQELLQSSNVSVGKRILNKFSGNTEDNVAEEFDPEKARIISIDDGGWVVKNIVTIIGGQDPKTSDLLDVSKPYSHYFSILNQLAVSHQKEDLQIDEENCVQLFSHIAGSFDQKPPSLWERYRTTIILLGAIATVTIIVSAFAAAFPAFFATHFVYGFAGVVNISAAAIGVLTTTQIAFITAGIIATLSAIAAGLGMLIKAGVEYAISLKQPKENEYTLINLETNISEPLKDAVAALSRHRKVLYFEKKEEKEEIGKGKEEEGELPRVPKNDRK